MPLPGGPSKITRDCFSALIKRLSLDLRQINFVRQTTMVAQIENDYLKQFATTLGQKIIDELQLKLEQVQADPTLLHFQAKPSDFELLMILYEHN